MNSGQFHWVSCLQCKKLISVAAIPIKTGFDSEWTSTRGHLLKKLYKDFS